MKSLSKFEMAAVKRTAKNVSMLRAKKAKLETKIAEASAELAVINNSIDLFEAPIKELTGGYTSEDILNGVEHPEIVTEVPAEIATEAERDDDPYPAPSEAPNGLVPNTPSEEVSLGETAVDSYQAADVPVPQVGINLFGNTLESDPLPFEV